MTDWEVLASTSDPRMENVWGTSLQGSVDVSYAELVEKFGAPTGTTDSHKVDAEWIIIGSDGTVATIYNYKDGKNYLGDEGDAVEDIRDWHIGGMSPKSRSLVLHVLGID